MRNNNSIRRLARPTIGRKFTLLFAVILVVGVASGVAIDRSLGRLDGSAAQIDLAGSLRWMARDAEVEARRIAMMPYLDRHALEERLRTAEKTISLLMLGGSHLGATIPPLPAVLRPEIEELAEDWAHYGDDMRLLLEGTARGEDTDGLVRDLHRDATRQVESANRITVALTRHVESIHGEIHVAMLRLALVDGLFLLIGLLALRRQIVRPVKHLAALSERISQGRYDERIAHRSRDEIGQLASAFNSMADRIEQDIREIAEDNRRLREAQQRLLILSQAVEHSPAAVVITGADAVIQYVNPKFVETTGYSEQEAIGRQPNLLGSGRMPAGFFEEMWQALREGREWRGQILNRRKDGGLYWEDNWISPVKDDRGEIVHYVAVKEDVTEKRRIEEERARLNELLEQRVARRTAQLTAMNKDLESFSYSVSHDLRGPLRGIHGFASLMTESCSHCENREALEHLERIRRATLRMGDIIDDLLDLARISRTSLKPERVDLSALAGAALAALAEREPGRAVQAEVEPGIVVSGDAGLLRVALENLIGNAWKFTAGRAPARIEVGRREEAGETVVFVRDNGAGFDMRYAGKLFLPFQRLHQPAEFEGSGIGLATVKKIVSLHGGRMWAEGEVGRGATFFLALPRDPAESGNGRHD